jgi:hypothetical protein
MHVLPDQSRALLLNRGVDEASMATLAGELTAATITRTQAAAAVLGSAEYQADLCSAYYLRYLYAAPTAGRASGITVSPLSANERFVAQMYQDWAWTVRTDATKRHRAARTERLLFL